VLRLRKPGRGKVAKLQEYRSRKAIKRYRRSGTELRFVIHLEMPLEKYVPFSLGMTAAFLAGMTGILGMREIGMAGMRGITGRAWQAAARDNRDFREKRAAPSPRQISSARRRFSPWKTTAKRISVTVPDGFRLHSSARLLSKA